MVTVLLLVVFLISSGIAGALHLAFYEPPRHRRPVIRQRIALTLLAFAYAWAWLRPAQIGA